MCGQQLPRDLVMECHFPRVSLTTALTWIFFSFVLQGVHSGKELGITRKGVTVDYDKDEVLAEILPKLGSTQTYKISYSTAMLERKSTSFVSQWTTTEAGTSPPIPTGSASTTTKIEPRLGRVIGQTTISGNDHIKSTTTDSVSERLATAGSLGDLSAGGAATVDAASGYKDYTPPHIRWPLSQERIVVMDDVRIGYSLQCRADGEPEPKYQWYKDTLRVGSDAGDRVQSFANGTLYWPEFMAEDNGKYQCVASNVYGSSVSVHLPIVREREPWSVPVGDTELYSVPKGDCVNIKCIDTPIGIPEYQKRWYIAAQVKELQLNKRVGTDVEGTLHFAFVQETDAKDFKCGLAPKLAGSSSSIRLYNSARLEVTFGEIVHTAPQIQYKTPNGVKATLGASATLQCFFSGFPTPDIIWTNSSNQQVGREKGSRYSIEDDGHTLVINPVLQEDEGAFTCTGNNARGSKAIQIKVNVTSPPLRFSDSGLTTLTKPEMRGDVTLKCQARAATGEHLEKPIWYRNNVELTRASLPDPKRYRFNSQGTQLHITGLKKSMDTACYQCVVKNSEGYLLLDGYLRVIDAIKVPSPPASHVILYNTSVVDITVHATGDRCCLLRQDWYLNGTRISPDALLRPPFFREASTGRLLFNASTVTSLSDYVGNYMCRVSNLYDSFEVTFTFSEYAPDTTEAPVRAESSSINLWWVGLLCGLLAIAIAVAIFIVCIKSRYYPGETYMLEKQELKHHLNPEEDLLNQSFQDI